MARVEAGDRVMIPVREATADDQKSGLFFSYYGGLTGVVQKVYNANEVAVSVDTDTLPEDVWKRHMNVRDQMRERWLQSLADDVRRRIPPNQRDFNLRYVILVSSRDLKKRKSTN